MLLVCLIIAASQLELHCHALSTVLTIHILLFFCTSHDSYRMVHKSCDFLLFPTDTTIGTGNQLLCAWVCDCLYLTSGLRSAELSSLKSLTVRIIIIHEFQTIACKTLRLIVELWVSQWGLAGLLHALVRSNANEIKNWSESFIIRIINTIH